MPPALPRTGVRPPGRHPPWRRPLGPPSCSGPGDCLGLWVEVGWGAQSPRSPEQQFTGGCPPPCLGAPQGGAQASSGVSGSEGVLHDPALQPLSTHPPQVHNLWVCPFSPASAPGHAAGRRGTRSTQTPALLWGPGTGPRPAGGEVTDGCLSDASGRHVSGCLGRSQGGGPPRPGGRGGGKIRGDSPPRAGRDTCQGHNWAAGGGSRCEAAESLPAPNGRGRGLAGRRPLRPTGGEGNAGLKAAAPEPEPGCAGLQRRSKGLGPRPPGAPSVRTGRGRSGRRLSGSPRPAGAGLSAVQGAPSVPVPRAPGCGPPGVPGTPWAPPHQEVRPEAAEEGGAWGVGTTPSPHATAQGGRQQPRRDAGTQGREQGPLTPVRPDNGHGRHRHLERINLPQIKICSAAFKIEATTVQRGVTANSDKSVLGVGRRR